MSFLLFHKNIKYLAIIPFWLFSHLICEHAHNARWGNFLLPKDNARAPCFSYIFFILFTPFKYIIFPQKNTREMVKWRNGRNDVLHLDTSSFLMEANSIIGFAQIIDTLDLIQFFKIVNLNY